MVIRKTRSKKHNTKKIYKNNRRILFDGLGSQPYIRALGLGNRGLAGFAIIIKER